eukprot:2493478-Amphidinium_carterae.1
MEFAGAVLHGLTGTWALDRRNVSSEARESVVSFGPRALRLPTPAHSSLPCRPNNVRCKTLYRKKVSDCVHIHGLGLSSALSCLLP